MKEEQLCVICGKSFIPKSKKQLCCSSECARVKSAEYNRARRKFYNCQYCGKPFWKPDAFRKKFCSTECQNAERRSHIKPKEKQSPLYSRECAWCGKSFETNIKNKLYCSTECGYEGNKKLHRDQWAADYTPRAIVCKECGTEFVTECGNKHSVFCCQSCAEKHERRAEHQTARHKEYMKQLKADRQKQIASSFVEEVSYDSLFTRDNGVCQICGLPVLYDKTADNNWSGTVDHIVPLSCGGEHSMANCQLAHRVCNSLKCTATDGYKIDWEVKAKENNYWRVKYDTFLSLFSTDVRA